MSHSVLRRKLDCGGWYHSDSARTRVRGNYKDKRRIEIAMASLAPASCKSISLPDSTASKFIGRKYAWNGHIEVSEMVSFPFFILPRQGYFLFPTHPVVNNTHYFTFR